MKKVPISKLFLYKNRFKIGYSLLFIAFLLLLFLLPLITPNGLSSAEMESVNISHSLNHESILNGNLVDLPYHALQKLSIAIFGLNTYGIKLPSIIFGLFLGLLFVLLLNRWFKNNVAIMASILAILSASFLYAAGSGTPLIMFVFWPTLMLWLGSKIQGEKKPNPLYSFVFAVVMLLSLFTPYMAYVAIFILIYVIIHPHLRFTIKNLPRVPFILLSILVVAGVALIIHNMLIHSETASELFFMSDFSKDHYFSNLKNALLPFFKWSGTYESTFLSPMIGLATLALAITGLISTTHGFFASRNSIASCLIVFTLIISGFNSDTAILLILPFAILIAHGFRYILDKWNSLFPENPYARIFGVLPVALFLGIIIFSDISHFVFGYYYNPSVANNFNNDLSLLYENLAPGDVVVASNESERNFYSILSEKHHISVVDSVPSSAETRLITLGKQEIPSNFSLSRIVTDAKSESSDRLYIYLAE